VQLPQLQQLRVHLWVHSQKYPPSLQWQLRDEEVPLPWSQQQWYVLELPRLDTSSLTQLTLFSITSKLHDSIDLPLPLQLRQLQLGKCSSDSNIAAVARLQNLQRLS
jgi:hypothetical protein